MADFPDISRREEVVNTRVRIGHTHLTHSQLITKELKPMSKTLNCRPIIPLYNDRLPKIFRITWDP